MKEYKQSPRGRFSKYKEKAKERGLAFSLTLEEFKSFWNSLCYYCGNSINGIGLDRINSSRGYFIDNVVPCCLMCNRMKSDFDYQTFLDHVRAIAGTHP